MTVGLPRLAEMDWNNSVPNQSGEFNNNEIENLRFIINHIDVFGEKRDVILNKCWKFISRLESPKKIIEAAKIIEANHKVDIPRKKVAFQDTSGCHIANYYIELIEKLAPRLKFQQITKRQFDLIIALLEDKQVEISGPEAIGLEKICEKFPFKALQEKLLPYKAISDEDKRILATLYAKFSSKNFDESADQILRLETQAARLEAARLFSLKDRDHFISLLSKQPDEVYFSWHQLLFENGISDPKTPKGYAPLFLIDRLKEKYPHIKDPIEQSVLRFLIHAEFKDIHVIPPVEVNKKNISLILDFLSLQPSDAFLKSKARIDEALIEVIDSLNPKNREDLVTAVKIQNYLVKSEHKNYETALQRLFNRAIQETSELTFWERIVSALVNFFGLALSEWVRADKAFVQNTLNGLDRLDITLKGETIEKWWSYLMQHKGLKSIDLSDMPHLSDDRIRELPLTLEHINLSGNKAITGKIIDHIQNMTNLKTINVSETKLLWQEKFKLRCLCDPIDLREFEVDDNLLSQIPVSAKSVLLGTVGSSSRLTNQGILCFANLNKLRHLEMAFLPEQADLIEILKNPTLTSLKLVGINSKLKDVEPLFFNSHLVALELYACKLVNDDFFFESLKNGYNENKSVLKKIYLNESVMTFYKEIVDSLEEITLNRIEYTGYVYLPLLQKCKKMFVPDEKTRNEIIKLIREASMIVKEDKNELIKKIIVQKA